MADQYKVTNVTGFGSRIVDSIKGIGFGFLLFLASFAVLYYNEGRVDLSQVAKTAINIDSSKAAPAEANGKLVSTNGKITSTETLGDDLYLAPAKYLATDRSVEMYAWVESSSSSNTNNTGGSSTSTTTYDYKKQWTSVPSDSSNFKVQDGHTNPAKGIADARKTVGAAKIGNFDLDMANIELPAFTAVVVNDTNVKVKDAAKISGNYVFVPGKASTGTMDQPQLGDMRITYTAVKQDVDSTVFGKLDGTKLIPFVDASKDNAKLYRIFTAGGTDAAIGQLAGEHTTMTWILRAVGFLMMWFGLSALFGPISTLLDVLPFFGSLSRAMIGVVTFVVSIVLTGATILVSMIAHNIYAVIGTAVAIVILAIVALKMKGKK
ncbi:MAG: TMEM43 family protein [Candidatus Peregrinibacteria bacterium]|nr:TMEM43 family protein [Candidatus Peregrinibacteria bacterium]